MRALALVSLVLLGACGSGTGGVPADGGGGGGDGGGGDADGGGAECLPGLVAIALSPANPMVTLDGSPTPAPITFTATGTFQNGTMSAIDPGKLAWTVSRPDDTPPGEIAAGVLTPYPFAGGTVTVTAADGCGVSGSTTVIFLLDVTVGTPPNPGDWAGVPVTGPGAPLVVYPSDQTRFPRNIHRTLFQWRTSGLTQFRLVFDGPGSKVTVYTDGAHALCAGKTPAAGCWEADELAWSFIAGSNAGSTVTWVVDGLDTSTSPPTIRRSATITIGFSKKDVKGAIFYWSTTSAGIRRANVAAAEPEDYITGKPSTTYSMPADAVKCVACHVVSRDGRYMAAPVDATSGKSLWIMEVTVDAPPAPLVKSVANTGGHGFATISPDNERVVAAWGGKLWMVERATGAYLADLPLGGLQGTHPDWGPNDELVFATGKGDAPGGASIATMAWSGGAWSAPSVIVQAAGGASNLFPMYSPDGKWIAFSRGTGGHGDLTAQLFIVSATGGTPVELVNANRVVSNQLGDGQTENNQPTWAPSGDFEWVAWNSKRAYGVVAPAGRQQIWVAAIDPAKLGTGEDPSYPAFRLQFQGLAEDNHRAYWTLDIRDPPPDAPDAGVEPDGGMCVPAGGMCDPVTDTCCDTGYQCLTNDDGLTYFCMVSAIP